MRDDAEFGQDGRLTSRRYGDVYFSGDGVHETGHVFVDGNDLPTRLRSTIGTFVIGETGFGTGLNFLVAMECFARIAPRRARLVFVSTEEHLLPTATLAKVHAQLPEHLQAAAAELRKALDSSPPPEEQGLWFCEGRVALHLLIGDAAESLRQSCFAADAWFLDGFSPDRNPAMWSFELLREVASHTVADGTFATYTVAGQVRRNLRDAGFEIHKSPGFGQKREMLRGNLRPCDPPANSVRLAARDRPSPQSIHVLGAGIAGATAADAFARRGMKVRVTDPAGIASGASGIPAAIIRPRLWLPGTHTPDAEMVAQAFRYTTNWLTGNEHFRRCGVMLCATDRTQLERAQERAENPATSDLVSWLTAEEASECAGLKLPHGAAFIPAAGTCDLAALTRSLLDHPNITVGIEPQDEQVDLTILATAGAPSSDRTQRVRGQAIAIRWPDDHTPPRVAVCTSGYLAPPRGDGLTWLGSTFDRDDPDLDPRASDDARILSQFAAIPELTSAMANAPVANRFVAHRSTAANRLPMVGLASNGGEDPLVTTLAHGSRGAVTAPWAADLLCRLVRGEPLPLSLDSWQRLLPTRS